MVAMVKMEIMSISAITRRILIFLALYFVLSFLGRFPAAQQLHAVLFTNLLQPIHNIVNSTFYANLEPAAFSAKHPSDVAISLYVKPARTDRKPQIKMTVNIYQMVWVPTILLIALIGITPGSIMQRLGRLLICLLIFYIVLAFYFQYRFAVTAGQAGGEAYSDAGAISGVLGFRGLLEPLVGVVFLSWLVTTFRLWQKALAKEAH